MKLENFRVYFRSLRSGAVTLASAASGAAILSGTIHDLPVVSGIASACLVSLVYYNTVSMIKESNDSYEEGSDNAYNDLGYSQLKVYRKSKHEEKYIYKKEDVKNNAIPTPDKMQKRNDTHMNLTYVKERKK